MALKFSTAYRNLRLMGCSFNDLFEGGELQIWSGSAPTTADAVASGTMLCKFTIASAARTPETLGTGIVNLTGGDAGSVDTITIDGYNILGAVVAFNSSLTQTAADVASQINKFTGPFKVKATSSGANITVIACNGYGIGLNTLAFACTSTTITTTINGGSSATFGGAGATAGVASVAGLTWGEVASGVISKTGTWSGAADSTGTAGYFRLVGSNNATGTSVVDSTYIYPRVQGTCALSGGDMNLGSLTITATYTYTVDTFSITEPSSA